MMQTLRVLIIDDNRSDRALIIRELQREFPQVEFTEVINASDFEFAISLGGFDAVVTDYQLGWTNGLEILRTIKAHYPRCPVIMFTGTGNEEIAVEALKSGLDDYVLKQSNRYIRIPPAIRVALNRLETQQRAALLEIRLQTLLNQVKVGIFRSRPDGTLIETNPVFLELFGIKSLAQANEMNLLDTQNCYARLVHLPPPQNQEREVQLTRSDGTQFWGLLITTLNIIEGISVVDGLLEDITERKQAEMILEARVEKRTAQLNLVNQELSSANQDLEEFAYSISHDLRAPLRAIQGFARILLEDFDGSFVSTQLEYLQRIAVNAEKLDTLITDLSAYSRLRQVDIHLESVSLSLVLTEALTLLELEILEQQAQIQVDEPLPLVRGNRLVLVQLLTNLLSNAIKFVASDVLPQVRVWAEQRGQQTRLWIEDNGIGIPSERQQQIFSPFTRLHGEEEYPGTGIGLAIVRKGVERMKGEFGVVSQLGEGSRFWLELPTVTE